LHGDDDAARCIRPGYNMADSHRYTFTAFDQRVQTPFDGSATTQYGSIATYEPLAIFDQVALEITAQEISDATQPTLTVKLSHSADGRWWLQKLVALDALTLTPNDPNVRYAFESGASPLLRFARLEVTLTGNSGSASADVRIVATVNDTRETQFARQMRKILNRQKHLEDTNFGCVDVLRGGSRIFPTKGTWLYDITQPDPRTHTVPAARGGFITKRDGHWYVVGDAQLCHRGGHVVVMSRPGSTVEVDLRQAAKHGAPGSC
jgi:hypothetical protein